jgi:FMN phosphatase YigB (HAD superfamily)
MTPIQGSIEALRRVATTGIVSLLSNNPIPFRESFSVLAPDAASILGANVLVSAALGARKPEHRLFTRALEKFGAEPHDAILIDDSAINIEGARATGMHAFQLCKINRTFDITGLNQALNNFTARNRQNP